MQYWLYLTIFEEFQGDTSIFRITNHSTVQRLFGLFSVHMSLLKINFNFLRSSGGIYSTLCHHCLTLPSPPFPSSPLLPSPSSLPSPPFPLLSLLSPPPLPSQVYGGLAAPVVYHLGSMNKILSLPVPDGVASQGAIFAKDNVRSFLEGR